jgi:hypothetical protein
MKIVSLLSLAVTALLVGCATQRQVASKEGAGTRLVYNAPFDSVWRAAVDASQRDGLEVTSSDRSTGYIAARRTVRVHTFGENVGIWLRQVSPSQTEVEVVSRQAGPPVAWLKNWENEIHRSIAANLSRDTSGYGTAPGDRYFEQSAPHNRYLERRTTPEQLTVPERRETVVIVPSDREQQQLRRLTALRSEREQREAELRGESDSARREAIGRQISILDSDIRLEEQRLQDLRETR